MNKTVIAVFALGAVACTGSASAEKLKATLDAKSEVHATTRSGTGTADLDYDAASKKLSWKATYSGLSGPPPAPPHPPPVDYAAQVEEVHTAGALPAIPNATSSPVEGSATLTDAQAADL